MDIQELLRKFKSQALIRGVFERLASEIPNELVYHNLAHTEDVLEETLLFALNDDLTEKEIELLAIGAAFHDAGFIVQADQHEKIGAELAVQAMRQYPQFSESDRHSVEVMIEDTVLTKYGISVEHCPTTKLSGYLIDADTSNLGRDDFFDKAELVRKEYDIDDKRKFYTNLLNLLRSHRWHTPAAHKMRMDKKEENQKKLERMVLEFERDE